MVLNDKVEILTRTNKKYYIPNFEKVGVIERKYKDKYGVYFDDYINPNSSVGLFWYDAKDLKIINSQEDVEMKNYNYVAFVTMFNDTNIIKKEYAFALYDTEKEVLTKPETLDLTYESPLVVVNSTTKNNRALGIVKRIVNVEEYTGCKITAQVIGTVNMDGYLNRKAEEEKDAELKRKKEQLSKQIQARVEKLNNLAYYERIASQFADVDPGLVDLVLELKELNGVCGTIDNKETIEIDRG